jgi:2-oxoglutarate ferredoxin oxidoreductase subunit gamma
VLDTYDTAVILNQQSLDKFESKVKPGGTLIYDPYGIHHAPTRTDINIVAVNAMEATFEMKNAKTYNMILLGALLKQRPIVPVEAVIKGLRKTLPERHHHLIPLNEEAIRKGMTLA